MRKLFLLLFCGFALQTTVAQDPRNYNTFQINMGQVYGKIPNFDSRVQSFEQYRTRVIDSITQSAEFKRSQNDEEAVNRIGKQLKQQLDTEYDRRFPEIISINSSIDKIANEKKADVLIFYNDRGVIDVLFGGSFDEMTDKARQMITKTYLDVFTTDIQRCIKAKEAQQTIASITDKDKIECEKQVMTSYSDRDVTQEVIGLLNFN